MKRLFLIYSLLLFSANINAKTEHIVASRYPIKLDVAVGTERVITFPEPVKFINTDQRLNSSVADIFENDDSLYVKAKSPFNAVRTAVRLQKSKRTLLIDIAGKRKAKRSNLMILNPNKKSVNVTQDNSVSKVSLVRFAIQHMYSPARLVSDNNKIRHTKHFDMRPVTLFRSESTLNIPLESWAYNAFVVTAVLVINQSHTQTRLNLDDIHGHWIASSLFPYEQLAPHGEQNDRTTLFLLSDRPFVQAIQSVGDYVR